MDYLPSAYLLLLLPFTSLFYACQGSSIVEKRAIGAYPLREKGSRNFYIAVGEFGKCGGVFYTAGYAITAAHCLHQPLAKDIKETAKANTHGQVVLEFTFDVDIIVGEFIGDVITSPCTTKPCDKVERVSAKAFIHRGYVPREKYNNDIALLKFNTYDIPYRYHAIHDDWEICSEDVLKARCHNPGTDGITNIAVCGLGRKDAWFGKKWLNKVMNYSEETVKPTKLHELKLKEPLEDCKKHEESTHAEFELLGEKNGDHVFRGDSGGPVYLMDNNNKPSCLYGIVKGNTTRFDANRNPIRETSRITEVAKYKDWIRNIQTQLSNTLTNNDPNEGKYFAQDLRMPYVWLTDKNEVVSGHSLSSSGSVSSK